MAFMVFLSPIILCFLVILPLGSLKFICPGAVHPPQGLTYAGIESNISGRASQDYAKIRIKLFFDSSIENNPYKGSVQKAADFWSNVLSVKPVDGRIFKSRDCENDTIYKDLDGSGVKEKYCLGSCRNSTQCLDIEVRKEHLDGCKYCTLDGHNCTKDEPEPGTGVENADLVFYVSAIQNKFCDKGAIIAYAGICDFEPGLDRPVFAHINICPGQNQHSSENKDLLYAIKHEMLHALGFSSYLFSFFRDKEGKALWPRDENGEPMDEDVNDEQQNVTKTIVREWHVRGGVIESERVFLVTPAVVEEARAHFNCSDLEGAELENMGGKGTRKSHLEARIFYEDAMKGEKGRGRNLFSRLDFAVLEDSGWYQVNYSQAEQIDFGRNLGCDFCMKSCKFWMDKLRNDGQSVEPYCDTDDYMKYEYYSCIGKHYFFSGCPLTIHEPDFLKTLHDPNSTEPLDELPRKYQNFDKISGVNSKYVPRYGSLDEDTDFCPVPVEKIILHTFTSGKCYEKSENDPNESEKEPFEKEEHPIEKKKEPKKVKVPKSNHSSSLRSFIPFIPPLIRILFML